MSALFGPEMKPWETAADDRLSPSSYAAGAMFGLVEAAVKAAARHGHDLDAAVVARYAADFAKIVVTVQVELGEKGGWNAMLNTRLRGALHTALEVVDDYQDSDRDTPQESYEAWLSELERVVRLIARGAAWLYGKKPSELVG